MSQAHVSRVEGGQEPSLEVLRAICAALGLQIEISPGASTAPPQEPAEELEAALDRAAGGGR